MQEKWSSHRQIDVQMNAHTYAVERPQTVIDRQVQTHALVRQIPHDAFHAHNHFCGRLSPQSCVTQMMILPMAAKQGPNVLFCM
jgi:hypothetical protein